MQAESENRYEIEMMLRPRYEYFLAGEGKEVVYEFPTADPYMSEDRAFLDAVRSGDGSGIQSTYSDAAKTYQLSWRIRESSEH